MKGMARYTRVLQFCSGPGSYQFYACPDHEFYLSHTALFFSTFNEPITMVDDEDEQECDYCHEGGSE